MLQSCTILLLLLLLQEPVHPKAVRKRWQRAAASNSA
jgi:hypothetical protein